MSMSPDPNHENDPSYWRSLAAEMRARAVEMGDRTAREKMLEAAASYERLAVQVEERVAEAKAREVVARDDN
jgi:hypothetical protein